MRSLSATLSSAQAGLDKDPIWKVVLSRSGQTTRGYDRTRIRKISQVETPDGSQAEISLANWDAALTSIDFEHFQAEISFGYATGVTRTAWLALTVYAIDDIIVPVTANGFQYRCSVAGTSAGAEPTWP